MILRLIGSVMGVICLLLMLVGLVPLLGWVNWINIPVAIVGLIFSSMGGSAGGRTMCSVAIIVGILRLIFGGGLL
ncbi:MAG: hypothetical protein H7257_03665 [Taibaiella sp.]|nr:hypothetical protein [Taibaiella sp.]